MILSQKFLFQLKKCKWQNLCAFRFYFINRASILLSIIFQHNYTTSQQCQYFAKHNLLAQWYFIINRTSILLGTIFQHNHSSLSIKPVFYLPQSYYLSTEPVLCLAEPYIIKRNQQFKQHNNTTLCYQEIYFFMTRNVG